MDPTYESARIERDPVWREAFRLSEISNDKAPIGWSQYIPAARELLAFKENAQADIDAVAGKLVVADQRVKLLEGIIREARAMALAGEWDEPMIAKALGAVFECDECMDTGVVGGMPKGDENDSCCARCARGGNPYFRKLTTIVHDGSGVAVTVDAIASSRFEAERDLAAAQDYGAGLFLALQKIAESRHGQSCPECWAVEIAREAITPTPPAPEGT